MAPIIGEVIKTRLAATGMSKTALARRLHMSPANVHKIFKRSTVDAKLLQDLSNILDYDFFRHFEPEVTRHRQEPDVLLIRCVADLESRVQVLERQLETYRPMAKAK